MNKMGVINIAKNQLKMEDDDYRAFLKVMTGKDSLRRMSEKELDQVIAGMERKGFKKTFGKKPISKKPYVRLIFALWKSCFEKGAIEDRSPKALRSFVENTTGVSDPEFLSYAQANPVIEALKAMEKR